ncbi:MAG: cob(I)yrinic acid a,c-diamide adenosyltransferase, partial [Negativicoccus succinicivorans]|nr:cob(I)yrinic acid a,c-diamide adenosyltransferase [Negativicoccus succinicivorans]
MKRGYIQVYTGDGKGKTTAAIGLAIRAVGAGLKVWLLQFMKSEYYSEQKILDGISPLLYRESLGKPYFIAPEGTLTEETKKVLEESLAAAQKVFAQEKVTQEEIDQATKTLREAIAQLKEQPVAVDKEILKEQIAQARGRKPEKGYQF